MVTMSKHINDVGYKLVNEKMGLLEKLSSAGMVRAGIEAR